MHLFWEANKTHTSCLQSYLNFLHALSSQYIFVMHLFLGSKKTNKTFLEGTCFAEIGSPNGSCLQGTPKYKICFGDMCLVKNPFFVLMSIQYVVWKYERKSIEEDASIKMFPQ